MPTVKELKRHLDTFYPDDEVIAYDLWLKGDVADLARQLNIEITEEQVTNVLESMNRQKDSSIGMNWDVVETHIKINKG